MLDTTRSTQNDSARFDSEPRATHVGASSLIKDNVYDAAGKRLAKIEEIILDTRTGCVRFVVLALGGFLGIGRKRFAVPWHVFALDTDYGRCIVDVALMPFMAVPVPEDDPWLQRTDRSCGRKIPYVIQLLRQQTHSGVTSPKRHFLRS
jgi:sporulation protein YlmC with PRC-barrel domain